MPSLDQIRSELRAFDRAAPELVDPYGPAARALLERVLSEPPPPEPARRRRGALRTSLLVGSVAIVVAGLALALPVDETVKRHTPVLGAALPGNAQGRTIAKHAYARLTDYNGVLHVVERRAAGGEEHGRRESWRSADGDRSRTLLFRPDGTPAKEVSLDGDVERQYEPDTNRVIVSEGVSYENDLDLATLLSNASGGQGDARLVGSRELDGRDVLVVDVTQHTTYPAAREVHWQVLFDARTKLPVQEIEPNGTVVDVEIEVLRGAAAERALRFGEHPGAQRIVSDLR